MAVATDSIIRGINWAIFVITELTLALTIASIVLAAQKPQSIKDKTPYICYGVLTFFLVGFSVQTCITKEVKPSKRHYALCGITFLIWLCLFIINLILREKYLDKKFKDRTETGFKALLGLNIAILLLTAISSILCLVIAVVIRFHREVAPNPNQGDDEEAGPAPAGHRYSQGSISYKMKQLFSRSSRGFSDDGEAGSVAEDNHANEPGAGNGNGNGNNNGNGAEPSANASTATANSNGNGPNASAATTNSNTNGGVAIAGTASNNGHADLENDNTM